MMRMRVDTHDMWWVHEGKKMEEDAKMGASWEVYERV